MANIDDTAVLDADAAELHKQLGGGAPDEDASAAAGAPGAADVDDDEQDEDATGRVDAELEAAETDAEREEIRRARREARKTRREKARAREAEKDRTIEMLRTTVNQLNERVARTESVTTSTQLSALDNEIGKADHAVGYYKNVLADATTKGDGQRAVEAAEYLGNAKQHLAQLQAVKKQLTTPRQDAALKPVNPAAAQHINSFTGEHTWYGGPASRDLDSRILTMIDNDLAAEGWDPATPGYWTELRKRGAERLPHRFNAKKPPAGAPGSYNSDSAGDAAPSRSGRSPVAGGGGGAASSAAGGKVGSGYMLSAERVRHAKEAGIWEDPKRRAAFIEECKAYDRSNGR